MRIATMMAAAAALVGSSTLVLADGMYSPGSMKDYAPAPYNWGGLYFGGSVGFGAGTTGNDSNLEISKGYDDCKGGYCEAMLARGDGDGDSLNIPLVNEDSDLNGGVYGLHIGYNLHRGKFVYGVEATISGADFDSTETCGILGVLKCETELDYYGTVIGRFGYAVDKTLFYVTGGLAYGEVKSTLGIDVLNFIKSDIVKNDETQVGWTAGVGIEHAMTDRFIIRVEYAHIDLGEESGNRGFGFGPLDINVGHKTDLEFDTIRIGASYKLHRAHEALEPLK